MSYAGESGMEVVWDITNPRMQSVGLTEVRGHQKLPAIRNTPYEESDLHRERVLPGELKATLSADTRELTHRCGVVESDEDVRVGELTNTRPRMLHEERMACWLLLHMCRARSPLHFAVLRADAATRTS